MSKKYTQPYWLVNHVIRCQLYHNCFFHLNLIKSLFCFIQIKIAGCTNEDFCFIYWNSWHCFNTSRKPVNVFETVIGCWAHVSLNFPVFFGCAHICLLCQNKYFLSLSILKSAHFGAINWSQLILEHFIWPFANWSQLLTAASGSIHSGQIGIS